jgi:hypothetical protein
MGHNAAHDAAGLRAMAKTELISNPAYQKGRRTRTGLFLAVAQLAC